MGTHKTEFTVYMNITGCTNVQLRSCESMTKQYQQQHWSRSIDSIVAKRIRERSLLLDNLEKYTNSSKRSRIRPATVESAERDHCRR